MHEASEAGFDRRGLRVDVVAVKRIAHLEAQRVTRTKAARYDTVLAAGKDAIPKVARAIGSTHDLDARLAGIARIRNPRRYARNDALNDREGLAGFGRCGLLRPNIRQQLHRNGSLQRNHRRLVADVGDRGGTMLKALEVRQVDRDVARVDDEQPDLVGQLVDDQIVDDATLGIEQKRVLSLTLVKAVNITRESLAKQPLSAGAGDLELPHVRDVKEPGSRSYRAVLFVDTHVVDRHLPACKINHARAELDVAIVQWRFARCGCH